MNNQFEYHAAKAHIDDLVRTAERAHMARGAKSESSTRPRRGLAGRLRALIGRCPELTGPEVHAGCP
jgi:hypothetical protein